MISHFMQDMLLWINLKAVPLPYDAISSLSELFSHVVALIDNEILVEDLEDLPALEVRHDLAASHESTQRLEAKFCA